MDEIQAKKRLHDMLFPEGEFVQLEAEPSPLPPIQSCDKQINEEFLRPLTEAMRTMVERFSPPRSADGRH